MEWLQNIHEFFYSKLGDSMYYFLIFVGLVALLAQWKLYEKAGQNGLAALVPIWNFIVFLRIVGRPAKDLWLFLIPFYGQFYMLPKVWIEVCQSFGRRRTIDYVLVVLLNGIYILNLGLSYDAKYVGPVHGRKTPLKPVRSVKPQASLA